ncbi:hypothetical protein FB45DRAFT_840594 [Roridomyces roridus]|uniref:C2H2-type domain-containing protein n=1 Tax=Roridomyces roridus TaxID=1738132 RepID=A0AAD7BDY7_9AGAR|nr:hypothetical protein FB45DRAFT_840594 [Roridomyces roridus]
MDSCEGDVDGDLDSEESASSTYEGRKHPCPTCGKRFNRPSSLRIHVNTHTGATPFRCPHPNCGRAFNVNSNMKRHYRNHTVAAASAASSGTTVTSPRARARVPTTPSPSLSPSRSPSRSPSPLSPSVATAPLSTAAKVYRYSESDVRSQRR